MVLRDGSEHALVDGKEDIRHSSSGCAEDIPKTDIIEVANEAVGSLAKGKRITPEEPLHRLG